MCRRNTSMTQPESKGGRKKKEKAGSGLSNLDKICFIQKLILRSKHNSHKSPSLFNMREKNIIVGSEGGVKGGIGEW